MWGIFVYGTLLQGESRGGLILAAAPKRIVPARTPGRLVDLGEYPGLIPAESSSQWVFGELAEFQDPLAVHPHPLLTRLDSIEEYRPESEECSLYLRRAVQVVIDDGDECRAWAYMYNRPCDPRHIIPSGDWRKRGK